MSVALLEVDEASGIPIWVQLRNRLAYLIDSGHYAPGERLPTVRALAADLSVNYHTVNKVYASLEHDGYISSKRGLGAYVKGPSASRNVAPGDAVLAEAVRRCVELGMTLDDVERSFAAVIAVARASKGADVSQETLDALRMSATQIPGIPGSIISNHDIPDDVQ